MPPTIQCLIVSLILACSLVGCAGDPQPLARQTPRTESANPDHAIIALIDGKALTHAGLQGGLYELAGDEVLTEYVLDRSLAQRCEAQGIAITPDQIQQERLLLGDTLSDNQQLDARLLNTLRTRRGLGPDRFDRLLRRNAMLRALTGDPIEPDPRAVARVIEQAFGQRYRVRLCMGEDPESLGQLSDRINRLDPGARRIEFADACFHTSTHPSGDRGGLIASLSPKDAGYPQSLLDALKQTGVGSCSPVIHTESGYAVVLVEAVIPATEPDSAQRAQIVEQLRQDTHRITMQRLAQQLLGEHEVIVLDRSLNWAWSNRP